MKRIILVITSVIIAIGWVSGKSSTETVKNVETIQGKSIQIEPYISFAGWADGWLVTTRELRQPYYESENTPRENWLYPWIEVYVIELELLPEQKKDFWNLVCEDYYNDGQRSSEEAKDYLIKRMQEILGIPKYNQFIFLTDTDAISIAPPRGKNLEGIDYEREIRRIEQIKKDRIRHPRKTYNKTQKRFDEFIKALTITGNLTEKQSNELKKILWKHREQISELEWELRYHCDAYHHIRYTYTTPDGNAKPLYKEKKSNVVKKIYEILNEMKKTRQKTKEKIKNLLNQNQQKVFEKFSGWELK